MAVTEPLLRCSRLQCLLALLSACLIATTSRATVLPEERVDILYHSFDGGGLEVDGPALLVRKNLGNSVSVMGKYYTDNLSGASIDMEAADVDAESGASPFDEQREEVSLGVDYLSDRTLISLGYVRSDEPDYLAETYSASIEQTFFGDLTILTLGASYGEDDIGRNDRPDFAEELERLRFSVSLSQILTTSFMTSFTYEAALDEGFLSNPYRQVRFVDPSSGRGFSFQDEVAPDTRNSDAFGIQALYHLPNRRSAIRAQYRYYEDNWSVTSNTYELRYTHAIEDTWVLELKLRLYDQEEADFFSDLFPFRDAQNFMTRDRRLGSFRSQTLGLGATYNLPKFLIPGFERTSINLHWDYINFDHDDFRDLRVSAEEFAPGEEPIYDSDAQVLRFFVSFKF
mgnify:CR=1 FL=1